MLHQAVRRIGFYFVVSFTFMLVMISAFSVFYHYAEGLSWLDAFYFTVITTRTIGFGDISPQTAAGKLGTIVNAIVPATVFLGATLVLLQTVMANLENYWKRLRMKSNRNHEIVVADVELLESIVTEYGLKNKPFVVVTDKALEDLPEPLKKNLNDGNYLRGNAADDDVLRQARIQDAHSIIIATADDNFNMYVLVTAKSLAAGVQAVVRVNRRETESKFRAVGADVLLPTATVLGRMLSEAAVSPVAHDFLVALHTHTRDPFFEETKAGPELAGRPVRQAFPNAVAVRRNSAYLYDMADLMIAEGDVVLGIALHYEKK